MFGSLHPGVIESISGTLVRHAEPAGDRAPREPRPPAVSDCYGQSLIRGHPKSRKGTRSVGGVVRSQGVGNSNGVGSAINRVCDGRIGGPLSSYA